MSFQIRHKEFGVYQGECFGLGFWHPLSDCPEQGFCEFPTKEEAKKLIKLFCNSNDCEEPLKLEDLSIEPFDKETSNGLIEWGLRTFHQRGKEASA